MIKKFLSNQMQVFKKSKESILHGIFIGLIVGIIVLLYDFLVTELIIVKLKQLSSLYICLLPIIGFLLTYLFVKWGRLSNTSMADEIVLSYHNGVHHIKLRQSIFKFLGSVASVSFGVAGGLEGCAKWIGGIVGVFYNRIILRLNFFEKIYQDPSTTMMSGAAAGVAAIFRAPLSGTILALESPYKKDFAHDPLIQAFISSTVSYAVYVAIKGSSKFFPIEVSYQLHYRDFLYIVLLGIISGFFSNGIINLNNKIKESRFNKKNMFLKYLFGGIFLSALAFASLNTIGKPISLFSGYDVILDIFKDHYELKLVLLILIFRILAFVITFSCGGIAGQFLPIAVIGACIGYTIQAFFGLHSPIIYSLIGISSFITASYNGLLFGPVLIAEITGQPNLVLLGILSSTISFLISNGISNSQYQREHR